MSAGSSTVVPVTTGTSIGTTIALSGLPVVSYAMAHNRIPVVDEVAVTADRDAEGAVLELAVVDAEGVLSSTCTHVVDLAAGDRTVVADVRLTLDPAQMLQVEEQRPGRVDGDAAARRRDARDGVVRRPGARGAAVAGRAARAVAGDARGVRHAERPGGRPPCSTRRRRCCATGRAAPRCRATRPVPSGSTTSSRAVFDAARARGIRYAEPPASWGDVGQQVRTPDRGARRAGRHLPRHRGRAGGGARAGRHPSAAVDGEGARLPRVLARGDARSRASRITDVVGRGQPGRPRRDPAGRDDDGHLDRRGATTSTPRTARRTRAGSPATSTSVLGVIDVFTARRNDVLPLPARARDADGRGAGRRVPGRPRTAAHPARPTSRRPRRRTHEHAGAAARRSSGRTRCSTSACATG